MAVLTIRVHVEPGTTDLVWWAEADGLEGWSAAADSLAALTRLAREAAAELQPGATVEMDLVDDDELPDAAGPALEATVVGAGIPSAGARAVTAIVPIAAVA